MYDDLVNILLYDVGWLEQGMTQTEHDIAEHLKKAADAIEELSKRVPPVPHGRLIDADALDEIIQEEISKDYNKEHRPKVTWSRAFEMFEDMVLDAPTIIPASEEVTQREERQDEAPAGPYDLLYEEGGPNTT